jgi:N-acetylglutamate synthase-like GNAT family acetyltransferase
MIVAATAVFRLTCYESKFFQARGNGDYEIEAPPQQIQQMLNSSNNIRSKEVFPNSAAKKSLFEHK